MIAAFLMISSSLAIVIDYNNPNDVSGAPVDYSDWIKISYPGQLSKIGSGEWTEIVGEEEIEHNYLADGKYVLMNDIIFTDKDTGIDVNLNDGFYLYVAAIRGTNDVTIALYHPEGDMPLTSASPIIVSFNGEVDSISAGSTSVTFSTDSSFTGVMDITAGGTADLSAFEGISRTDFAVAVTIKSDKESSLEESPYLKSNGNMDPLCSEDPFTGTFHGNGKNIIGLETVVYSDDDSYSGLFAKAEGAKFDGVSLIGGSSTSIAKEKSYAGGLVGYSSTITMTNCYNTGSIISTASSSNAYSYAGGLAGYIRVENVTITNCYNTGTLSVSGTNTRKGGILGYCTNPTSTVSTIFITNCYFADNAISLDFCGNAPTKLIKDGLRIEGGLSGPRTLDQLKLEATYYAKETRFTPGPESATLTFPGWNFNNTWCIDENVNNGYPFLKSSVITEQPSNITADKVDGNAFSIKLGAFEGTIQWQKFTNGQWNDITGATGLTYTTKATDAFGDQFRCVVTLSEGGTVASDSASLLNAADNGNGGNGGDDGGDDGGDNTMLFIGIAAVAAIAVIGVVYFMFIRKP